MEPSHEARKGIQGAASGFHRQRFDPVANAAPAHPVQTQKPFDSQ
jgi:hypothetical protein